MSICRYRPLLSLNPEGLLVRCGSTPERAVDALGHHVKPELNEIREELSFLRPILEDVLHEVRSVSKRSGEAKQKTEVLKGGKKRA